MRIASRGSQLALWQARFVQQALERARPGVGVEIEVIRTTGDRITDVPLSRIGDRGLFTKEIDDALLSGAADLAVHSLKDVPTRLPEGLALAAITEREDPRDVLIGRQGRAVSLADLPAGARVGTSSLRRRAQLRALRPDVEVADLRGNLNTRLAKLDAGEHDAIILAAAGVLRLGWAERIGEWLDAEGWLPAVGQGALAVVVRADRPEVIDRVAGLHHEPTARSVAAERSLLHALQGGCQIPIGALAQHSGDGTLSLAGMVADLDGTRVLRVERRADAASPAALGREVADALLDAGAGEILDQIRRSVGSAPLPPP